MTRRYDSFVVRCWDLGNDDCRIDIEHMQSAGHIRVSNLAEAIDWITAQCGKQPAAPMAEWSQRVGADEEVLPHDGRSIEEGRTE